MKQFMVPLIFALTILALPILAQESAPLVPVGHDSVAVVVPAVALADSVIVIVPKVTLDPNWVMVFAGLGGFLATIILKYAFPKIPQVLIPWVITPLLGLLGGWINTLLGGSQFWQLALGACLSSLANGLASHAGTAIKSLASGQPLVTVKEAAAKVAPFLGWIILASALATGYTHNAQAQTRQTVIDFPEVITGVVRAVDAQDGGTTFEVFAGQGFGASYSYVQYDPADSLWKTIVGVGPVIYCRKLSGEAWEFNPGIKVKGAEVWLFPFEPSLAVTYQVGSLPDGISRVNVWLDQDLLALFNALF